MNKDAEGRWKVGRSYIKLKMRVECGIECSSGAVTRPQPRTTSFHVMCGNPINLSVQARPLTKVP